MRLPYYITLFTLLAAVSLRNAVGYDWYVTTNGTAMGASWGDASGSIQDMLDIAISNDTVWVGAGTYVGNFTNYPGVTLRSSNGIPTSVILDGDGNDDIVLYQYYEPDRSPSVIGMTIKNANTTIKNAGGVAGGSIYNCIIVSNTVGVACSGGGVGAANVYNSLLTYNSAGSYGGAAAQGSVLYGCTVVYNTAVTSGGGVHNSTLVNCIVRNNTPEESISADSLTVSYSCGENFSTGTSNITADPLFLPSSDFRLQSNSPCINLGNNLAWSGLSSSTDLDGNKRIWPFTGTVDMGGYEFNSQSEYDAYINVVGDLNFGAVPFWADRRYITNHLTMTIQSTGSDTITVTNISYPTNVYTSITNMTISGNTSSNILVYFSPIEAITYDGVVTIESNAEHGTNTLDVTGRGLLRRSVILIQSSDEGPVLP